MFGFLKKRPSNPLNAQSILDVLDRAADAFVFPMLDNGYVYLAASRMSLFRSNKDWAMVFEIFGYSPRAGTPDLAVVTVASTLHNRNDASDYATKEAHGNYLKNNPYWETRYFYPIENDDWMDDENPEMALNEGAVLLRGHAIRLPAQADYAADGIVLENGDPMVFELCRFVAGQHKDAVLATPAERRVSVLPGMAQLLVLDEWHHPDLADGQKPSQTKTFQELAAVLEQSAPAQFTQPEPSNNHWSNWPVGGSL